MVRWKPNHLKRKKSSLQTSKIDPAWEKDFQSKRKLVNRWLEKLLPSPDSVPRELHEAMRYSVMAGGKRLRPMLALYAYAYSGRDPLEIIKPACALEYIHTYSLIHDDLPCMDDDDLRRGQPTVHKKFNEAIAVLAGDALHAYAFELLASAGNPRVVSVVAHSIGTYGMLGGQICDIMAENREVTLAEVEHIHRGKTAALIRASLMMGAMMAGVEESELNAFSEYGKNIGLAFQIVDDILDITAETETLGKTAGKDLDNGKATYPRVIGLERSRQIAEDLTLAARDNLAGLKRDTIVFGVLADLIISRQY